jgi:hypothetical protein
MHGDVSFGAFDGELPLTVARGTREAEASKPLAPRGLLYCRLSRATPRWTHLAIAILAGNSAFGRARARCEL